MATADDDISDHSDGECCRAFQRYVELEQAKSLPEAEKKQGKGTAVRKALKDGLKEPGLVSGCESSLMPKLQDKKTKKIKDEDFVKQLLPLLAEMKLTNKSKGKKPTDKDRQKEEKRMRKKLCDSVKTGTEESKGATKADKVTARLTDTAQYTGAHKERFDESGKGKGIKGREDRADNSGYVGNYKGAGTYDKK